MSRLWAWLTGGAAGFAAYRLLKRRHAVPAPAVEAEPGPDPRAEELRTKLDEAKAAEPEVAPEEPQDVEARRRDVHEHGRAAIEEMRGESDADE